MKNKNLIYIGISLLTFVLVSLAYFSPVLSDNALFQNDIMQYKGAAEEQNSFRKTYDEETYWSNSMFSGMPNYQSGAQFSGNFLSKIDKVFRLYLPRPADYFFLLFAGFFLLGMVWLKNWKYALAGSFLFALSTYFFIVTDAGHNAKVHTIAYFAPFVAGVLLLFERKYLWGFILTSLFLSLQLNANHPQMTYYLLLGMAAFGLYQTVQNIQQKTLKPFFISVGLFALASILSLGMNSARLLATYEYSQETTRGKSELTSIEHKSDGLSTEYITDWSYGIGETANLFVPNFYGGGNSEADFKATKFDEAQAGLEGQFRQKVQPQLEEYQTLAATLEANPADEAAQQRIAEIEAEVNQIQSSFGKMAEGYSGSYWGEQPFTSGPAYQGCVVVLLAILALFWVKSKHKWWLLGATVLSFMMAWGKNFSIFTNFMIDYFPMYNKFRAVSSALVLAEFTIPILALLGLYEFLENRDTETEKKKKILYIVSGVIVGILAIFYLFGNHILAFHNANEGANMAESFLDAIKEDRFAFFQKDILRTLGFVVVVCIILYVFLLKIIKESWMVLVAITLLSTIDLWSVGKRYLNEDSFVPAKYMNNPFVTDISESMMADADKHPQLNGILGLAKMNSILKDIKEKDKGNYRVFNTAYNPFNENNTSYFHQSIGGYHGAKLRRYQEVIDAYLSQEPNTEVLNMLNAKYILVGETQEPKVIPNVETNGNAWFVQDVKVANNPDEEFKFLEKFHSKREAIVNSEFKIQNLKLGSDSTAVIVLENYKPNKLQYKSKSQANQLGVFSEIYYPHGWKATIDGKEAEILKTNYLLRGLIIPKGEHTIEFTFQPKVVQLGGTMQWISFILFLLLALGGIFWERKKIQSLISKE